MPMAKNLSIILIFAACLVLSFFLSGMEAGVFALSRLRIRQQMRAGRVSAQVLHRFLENPENFLWTIVVGNTLANFAVFGWLFAVDRPFDAEAIDDGAEAGGPERLLKLRLDRAPLGESLEDALGGSRIVHL